MFFILFLEDFPGFQAEVEAPGQLDLIRKVRTKNPPKAPFFLIQFYSSFGLKAARIARSAIQERVNFNVISTHIVRAH